MAEKSPALFTHCTNKKISVKQVFTEGVDNEHFWVPRLTPQAMQDLAELKLIVQSRSLTPVPDSRRGPFCMPNGKFDSGNLYRLLKSKDGMPHPAAKFVWSSKASPRVQFFMWLLVHGRIQRKSNLFRKKVVDSPCEVCNLADETPSHLVGECDFASQFWMKLGIQLLVNGVGIASEMHLITAPPHAPAKHFSTFIALCCWMLWKRRNGVVFRNETTSMNQFLSSCIGEAKLWKYRLPKKERQIADSWCNLFNSAM
jgi:hypothetical protein